MTPLHTATHVATVTVANCATICDLSSTSPATPSLTGSTTTTPPCRLLQCPSHGDHHTAIPIDNGVHVVSCSSYRRSQVNLLHSLHWMMSLLCACGPSCIPQVYGGAWNTWRPPACTLGLQEKSGHGERDQRRGEGARVVRDALWSAVGTALVGTCVGTATATQHRGRLPAGAG